MALSDVVPTLPAKPGVYLFKGDGGRVLYVGKARSLRSRVRSYFQPDSAVSRKTLRLRQVAQSIEFITTATEGEALLLEENLIKVHRPKYNVILKDDKHYPYLRLGNEAFPRLEIVRQRRPDGARYFGPYPGAGAVHETLRLMRRIFPLRTCSDHKFRTVSRPCLLYHIKRCPAPCTGLIDQTSYREIVEGAGDFLEGRHEKVIRELETGMAEAAERLEFERAAELRDRMRAVRAVTADQAIVLGPRLRADVFALARDAHLAVVDVFSVREGRVLGRRRYSFTVADEEEDGAILRTALRTHYAQGEEVPPLVWVSHATDEADGLRGWLGEKRSGALEIRQPRRGDGRRVMQTALENAREGLVLEKAADENAEASLEALADALSLPGSPHRIEGYDISNTQGTLPVAAMVVFEEGVPRQGMYRRFNLRTVEGPNDFASLKEAVRRRFGRIDDSRDTSFSKMPDLLLIDGGKGQISAVSETLREIGVDLPIVGLAKREEWLYVPGESDPIILPPTHPGLRLLERMRDEAHRFGNTAHAARRSRRMRASALDAVPGLGPKRKKALLRRFGSVRKIREASLEELIAAGLPRSVAQRMLEGTEVLTP